jgi:hypothetical protein
VFGFSEQQSLPAGNAIAGIIAVVNALLWYTARFKKGNTQNYCLATVATSIILPV